MKILVICTLLLGLLACQTQAKPDSQPKESQTRTEGDCPACTTPNFDQPPPGAGPQ